METTQRNSDWEQMTTVKKGNVGEQLVQEFLEKNGFVCYKSVSDGAHPFDFLCVKDKRLAIAAEVKTKSLMNKYNGTGFNKSTYEDYIAFSQKHNIKIFVFFVDEHLQKIYGNWLHVLDEKREETLDNGESVFFPVEIKTKYNRVIRIYPYSAMRLITDIPPDVVSELKNLSQRNYAYRTA